MSSKAKRGLGPVVMNGKIMPWGKGVIAGDFIFLSGLEGRTTEDGTPVEGMAAQAKLALDRGRQYLEEVGADPENIVRMIQYLSDPSLAGEYHSARDEWMREHTPQLLEDQSYAGVLMIQQFTAPTRLIEIELTVFFDPEQKS